MDKVELIRTSDAFDAFVSALVARAAALGLTELPPAQLAGLAALEGWIHLPVIGARQAQRGAVTPPYGWKILGMA
jgi:hypothetical protein